MRNEIVLLRSVFRGTEQFPLTRHQRSSETGRQNSALSHLDCCSEGLCKRSTMFFFGQWHDNRFFVTVAPDDVPGRHVSLCRQM